MQRENVLKNENHLTLEGWMINELKLSGNELIVYGIIFGQSQYGVKNGFFSSNEILKEWTGINEEEINQILKKLSEKRLIKKNVVITNKQKKYFYTAETKINKTSNDTVKDTIKIKKNSNNLENAILVKIKEEMGCEADPFDVTIAQNIIRACIQYSLSESEIMEYIEWSVQYCKKKPKEDIYNYYYKFAEKHYNVAKFINFKIESRQKKEEEDTKKTYFVKCPVCHIKHDQTHDCPNCGLPEGSSTADIENYMIRYALPKAIRNKLDFEVLEHQKKRPDVMNFDIAKYNTWKEEEKEIYAKYKREENIYCDGNICDIFPVDDKDFKEYFTE